MTLNLPPIRNFKLNRRNYLFGWSDQYGAIEIAKQYTYLRGFKVIFEHFWMHGVEPPWLDYKLLPCYAKSNSGFYFVTSERQVKILKSSGLNNVYAIGLPIIYLSKKVNYKRVANSLLVMPPHTLQGYSFEDINKINEYVEFIKVQKRYYKHIVACIHSNCLKNGYWEKEFGNIGINVVEGALTNDANALERQKYLFSIFETVTTSDWGSHVAYALFFGCKVSICGPNVKITRDSFKLDHAYKNQDDIIDFISSERFTDVKDKYLSKFYVLPKNSISDIELGQEFVGFKHKLSPFRMRMLFHWHYAHVIYDNTLQFFFRVIEKIYTFYKNFRFNF